MQALMWKPLLAATLKPDPKTNIYDFTNLPYPLYGSPKIDGFRALIQGGKVVSRKGILFRNKAVQSFYGRAEYEGLDGELVLGSPWAADVFNRTQNVVNSGKDEDAVEFEKHGGLWIIDRYFENSSPIVSFYMRYTALCDGFALLRSSVTNLGLRKSSKTINVIKQTTIKTEQQLIAYEQRCLSKGYEGIMLRAVAASDGPYPQKPGKENRSTLNEFTLVKLKRREFSNAIIQGWDLLEHNVNEEKTAAGKRSSKKSGIVVDNNRVGSIRLKDGKYVFDVNVQTNKLRDKGPRWWQQQLGKKVRYSYQLIGTKDSPRQPQATFQELL